MKKKPNASLGGFAHSNVTTKYAIFFQNQMYFVQRQLMIVNNVKYLQLSRD